MWRDFTAAAPLGIIFGILCLFQGAETDSDGLFLFGLLTFAICTSATFAMIAFTPWGQVIKGDDHQENDDGDDYISA